MSGPATAPGRARRLAQAWTTRIGNARAALMRSLPAPQKVNPVKVLLLLVVAGAIQLAMLRPPYPSDSLAYFHWAENIGGNQVHHGTTRLGVLLPVRAAIGLFGSSEAAYHLVPFVMFLLLVGATYVVGVQIAGNPVGTVAALAMATSMLVLEYTSQILPDPFAAAWFVTGLACFLVARSSPRRTWWLVAGAAAVGMAYLCREYVVFLAPLLVFVGWTTGWRRRDWIVVGAVLAAVLAVEVLLMVLLFGDPLARVRALTGFAERVVTGESERLVEYGEDATRLTVLARTPVAFAHYAVGVLLGMGGLAGAVLVVFDRRRRWMWGLLLVWIGSFWGPMMLLAGILDPTHPRIRDNRVRYWFLVIPALYLLLSAALTAAVRAGRDARSRWAIGVLAGVLVVGALAYDVQDDTRNTAFRSLGATQWDEVRDWLQEEGDGIDRIYLDDRMATVLPLYARERFGNLIWDGEIVVFEQDGEFLPTSEMDGAIILHELGLRFLANRGLTVPEEYSDPGPDWEVPVRRADGSLTILVERDPP